MEKSSMNIKLRERLAGLGLIGWVIAIPLTLILLLIVVAGFYEGRKAYWDHQVTKMCEKDGGVTVFETVTLTKEQYFKNDGYKGMIAIFPESTSKPHHEFYKKQVDTIIKKSTPRVVRSEYTTYRKTDNKKLGKWVTYSRRGGDFPTGFHPSSFGCTDITDFKTSVAKEIFSFEMEKY